MEDKSTEEEKTEDIRTELDDQNRSLNRPRNFSLRRRSEVYYFSDESARGILKRVPVKNGDYKMFEQETVLEKSGLAKSRKEIWSDVSLNSPGIPKANKNSSSPKYVNVFESAYHDKNSETIMKPKEKIAGCIPHLHGLKNVAGAGAYRNNSKTKDECQDPMTTKNQVQKDKVYFNPFEEIKKQQPSASVETNLENLQGSDSDEEGKWMPEDFESSNEYLSDKWTETCLSDDLNDMLTKTSNTEL